MEDVFADTNYWVAKIHPGDQWHERAVEAEFEIGIINLITTELVLVETLNYFSDFRADVKETALLVIENIIDSDEVEAVSQTNQILLTGLELYKARLDKGYSLTDCISMNVCREKGIWKVLTRDHHFEQEGFKILL